MLEFNLLPDVKMEYIKTRRMQRLVISLSVIVGAISLAVFVFMILLVDVAQKVRIHSLNSNINSSISQIKSNTNLNKILTIQNQLETLPTIQSQTPVTSRLFNYISQVTPAKATISDLNINMTANTVSVSGGADSLNTVNQFVDTLKFTTYSDGTSTKKDAFNTVVLSSFNYSSNSTNGSSPAQYTITFNFDPAIFSSANNVTLTVPSITTTRSVTSQPTDLFKNESGS